MDPQLTTPSDSQLGKQFRQAAVVLVHGAWHGAWCWQPVLERLSAAGVEAIAVDLPGHGDDPGPMGDLHADADRVRQTLDEIQRPVVLVGHSYGGAVITEAGTHSAVAHLLYLAALALDTDETCATAAASEAAAKHISPDGRPELGAGFINEPAGIVTLDRCIAARYLYSDCDEMATKWALDRLGGQPLVTLQQSPHAVGWRAAKSTYVVCASDMAVHPDLQRLLAKRCNRRIEWACGHSPFLSRPELVAGLITDLAARVKPNLT
jgi:pimeloyl-ACP methyl ester carboxylesterase